MSASVHNVRFWPAAASLDIRHSEASQKGGYRNERFKQLYTPGVE